MNGYYSTIHRVQITRIYQQQQQQQLKCVLVLQNKKDPFTIFFLNEQEKK